MLHKLKPVPRALVILTIVGGLGFGLTKIDFSSFSKKTEPVVNQVEAPPVTVVTPPTQVVQPPQIAPAVAAPAEEPVALQPATSNSGLDAVLNAGRK